LQVRFDRALQNLQIVALDGVPTGSQGLMGQGAIVNATNILILTAGRSELMVTGPSSTGTNASLVTVAINTGPDGDNDPQRTLATIQTVPPDSAENLKPVSTVSPNVGPKGKQRFAGLPVKARTLYFSEANLALQSFITVDGATPNLFEPNNPPTM
jgi:hypothetical protein